MPDLCFISARWNAAKNQTRWSNIFRLCTVPKRKDHGSEFCAGMELQKHRFLSSVDRQDIFKVDCILDSKFIRGTQTLQYLVKWLPKRVKDQPDIVYPDEWIPAVDVGSYHRWSVLSEVFFVV